MSTTIFPGILPSGIPLEIPTGIFPWILAGTSLGIFDMILPGVFDRNSSPHFSRSFSQNLSGTTIPPWISPEILLETFLEISFSTHPGDFQ